MALVYRLISSATCPFVQRAEIVLLAKRIEFEVEYVDLNDKPGWLTALSPLGQVPLLLLDGETPLFESQVIVEYIEETTTPPMHPADPLRKARNRALVELVSTALQWLWGATRCGSEDESRALMRDVEGALGRLVADRSAHGPFFNGSSLGIVDAAVAPLLQRIRWADGLGDYGIFERSAEAHAWTDALLSHPAVRGSGPADLQQRSVATYRGWLGERRDRESRE